ncbi:ermin isoform 2-T2 [Callospermophilus lateralis]|uniref:ermin isoform X2 n=1 Tax=Callospermophilus lateralis TaxID=76772 RepID=UPI004038CC51
MTDVPGTFSGAECNGNSLPETVQQPTTKINEDATDMETPPDYRVEPGPEDVPTKGNQEERGKSQGNILLNRSMDEKILKETRAEEMTFREGLQWEKIPLSSSNQEMNSPKERIAKQPLEERENEDRKNKAHQAAQIEWLGFRKPSEVDMLHSQHGEQEEVWNEEAPEDNDDDYNDDEDEVRVIEFKKKYEEGSQFKEETDASEDSPLSSPGSQPVTPDEQPMLGKKGDISRNAYSRYNTISYRKIRKGNTKQRIDEFESMMHL